MDVFLFLGCIECMQCRLLQLMVRAPVSQLHVVVTVQTRLNRILCGVETFGNPRNVRHCLDLPRRFDATFTKLLYQLVTRCATVVTFIIDSHAWVHTTFACAQSDNKKPCGNCLGSQRVKQTVSGHSGKCALDSNLQSSNTGETMSVAKVNTIRQHVNV